MSPIHAKPDCEVAVVGAGPYGLSIAAHLNGAGVATRIFGEAMSFWRGNMPKGMRLRSPLRASDLADPDGALTLAAFAATRGLRLTYPIPLAQFVDYGEWFQANAAPDLDTRKVERIEAAGEGFRLRLADGDIVTTERVVIATGLGRQQVVPAAFAGLPADLVSHASAHHDLDRFAGQRIAVVGRGQSACEWAALLSAGGADVELISRGDIDWVGSAWTGDGGATSLSRRLREAVAAPSGVGPFPLNWLAEFPDLVRRLPATVRQSFSQRCLRPGATAWLKPAFASVETMPGRTIVSARQTGSRIAVELDAGETVVDHVVLATGYHIDVSRMGLFAPALLDLIARRDGLPVLAAGLESSVRGLHFAGASAVGSFGPLLRFVAGAGYAARHLTRFVAAGRLHGRRAVDRNAGAAILART